MRLCIRCGLKKDESEFNTRNFLKGYLQSVCRDCQRQDGRDRYATNTETVRQINRSSRQRSKELAQEFVTAYLLSHPCSDCGERDIAVLTFDHVRGSKKGNISDLVRGGYSIKTIEEEIEKTEVTCFNCHMKRERKRRDRI